MRVGCVCSWRKGDCGASGAKSENVMRCVWDITPISTPATSPLHTLPREHILTNTSTNPAYSTAHAQFLLPQQRVNIGMAERVAAALVERAISGGLQQLAMERSSQPVAWPSSEGFTAEKGEKAIERTVKVQGMTAGLSTSHVCLFVQRWQVSDSWKYCIDYLGARTEGRVGGESGDLHCYRVQWSQPTRRNPVPVATASVYFFLQEHGKEVCYQSLKGGMLPVTERRCVTSHWWVSVERNVLLALAYHFPFTNFLLNPPSHPPTHPESCAAVLCT